MCGRLAVLYTTGCLTATGTIQLGAEHVSTFRISSWTGCQIKAVTGNLAWSTTPLTSAENRGYQKIRQIHLVHQFSELVLSTALDID